MKEMKLIKKNLRFLRIRQSVRILIIIRIMSLMDIKKTPVYLCKCQDSR